MMGGSSKISKTPTLGKVQTIRNESSPILLQNSTIQHLKELYTDLSKRDKEYVITYDLLVIELIKSYRKKKGLGEIWGQEL